MDNHIEVIGIDHGWSNMKTVNYVFTSGVKEITTEPAFLDNVVEWNGVYYKVGGKRLEVKENKVGDDNYYILTLACVAKELEKRGKHNADVFLSVGLPLTRFGAEKEAFIWYLTKNKAIDFKFEGKKYHINIERVSVFPQCYAAVIEQIRFLPEKVIIVDIGSWTIDIMPVEQYAPNEAECITIPNGIIKCMRAINEQCVRQIGDEIAESDIQDFIIKGDSNLPKKYKTIIEVELHKFIEKVYYTIKESGYNLETTSIIFVGGGATIMKLDNNKYPDFQYIEDVKANAKGFEYLGRLYLASKS